MLSDCLKQNLPPCLKEKDTGESFCFASCAFHLDAYGWKKDFVTERYLSNIRGKDKELSIKIKEMTDIGVIPAPSPQRLFALPPGSFCVSFSFQLRRPYISKDDTEFYVIDNPVKKDWVFKVPYIAPSQWKGCLHAAMVRQLADWWANPSKNERGKDPSGGERSKKGEEFVSRRLQLVRLFGNEQGVEVDTKKFDSYLDKVGGDELAGDYRAKLKRIVPEGHRRGRLMFYPTFFDRIGVEVINPHDRETGAGKLPVYFETVPEGTCGRFALLYVPFDRAGKDEGETLREAAADLCRVAEGIAFLLTEFGIGAKTADSFGLAAGELPSEGVVAVRLAGKDESSVKTGKFRLLDSQNSEGLVKTAETLSQSLARGGGNR
ncbi:protein of unknown function DUF324 [Ammonifex degensii KC4]|uniref:Uncharacterized protein n=2 Tax=Ammonifex degensii TaxID=42838 RepID=C9RCG9_AMMDK|nr:protein of unknown function DUF324 [Ammonifex degensii KC4]